MFSDIHGTCTFKTPISISLVLNTCIYIRKLIASTPVLSRLFPDKILSLLPF